MTVELTYYIFISLIGLFFCFSKIRSEKCYFIITFILFLLFSVITRYSGFDIDMNTYAEALKSDVFSIYYVKEPVYWVTSRYIYDVTQSPEVTFIVYDVVAFLLVLNARKNMEFPQYFPYLFLLFFPAVMGLNNVYRQYLSYAIFLYFISLLFIQSGFIKKSFYTILAILTHNMAALFTPLFFTINKKKRISYKALFLYILVILLLPMALGTKSNSDTGSLGVGVYLIVLSMLIVFYALSYRLQFNEMSAKFFYFLLYMLALTSISAILMGSGQSKRVGMFSLMIALVPLVKSIEDNYKQKKYPRMAVYIVLISPTLLFTNSINMLLT